LADQYGEFRAEGAEVIAVVNDTPEHARSFFGRTPPPYPFGCDSEHDVYDMFGVASRAVSLGQRPGLFIIDIQGIVRFAHIGTQQWELPDNDDVLGSCRGIPCRISSSI
jgi:peroxiredoxin